MATFTPAAYGARTDYNFVSSFNLHKPEVDQKLVKRYGSGLLTGLLNDVGLAVPVSSKEYSHFEEDRLMPKIKATTAGAGAGAAASFTLDASSEKNVDQDADPYIGTPVVKDYVPVRDNDTIMIKPAAGTVAAGSYIKAIVSNVDAAAGTFDATPIDSADSVPAIGAADEIIIYGNAHGEGSSQPQGLTNQVLEFKNNLQIIKHNYKITGTERDIVLWTKVKGMDGKEGYVWMIKGEDDTYRQFLNFRELTLLLSEKLNNVAVADAFATANEPISMTEGLIPFCNGGVVSNYNAGTGMTLTDFEDLVKELDKEKGSKENLLLCGINLSLDIDRELRDDFTAGAISYGHFNFGQEKALDLEFSRLKVGGYTFHKKTYDAFNDFQTLGADGFGFPNEGMIIPMSDEVDARTREKIPSIRMRYLQDPNGGNSREMMVTPVDKMKVGDNGEDAFEIRYLSECGFEGFGQNRFGYIKQA